MGPGRSGGARTWEQPDWRAVRVMEIDRRVAKVLVVSEDAVLGRLIALNLRCRGFLVEHADLGLARSTH